MANLYDELKHVVSAEMVGKLAGKFGGSTTHVESAANQLLPTLLAKFMTKSDTPAVHGLLQDAGKLHLPGVEHLLEGTAKKPSLGEKFVSTVMGNQEGTLHAMAQKNGLSPANAKTLTAGIGAVVAGFLGKRIMQHGGCDHVLDELKNEKNTILSHVPAEYKEKLHLSSDSMHCAAPHHRAAAHKAAPQRATMHHETPPKKRSLAWLWWLLGLLLLALLLGLLFGRGCRKPVVEPVVVPAVVEAVVDSVAATYELALPSGEKLTVTKGGMIDEMVAFLQSDTYKNATDAELNKHWFEFRDVDFKFDSATEFETPASANQVENRFAFLMKYFPETKIRFGGNADQRGRDGYNQPLSEARAETLKKMLVAKGIAAGRITTLGFSEQNARIPATATEAERAPDRDFAVRFVK
jgi:outer membrane protein OmpA-like peptidoglycan-associated protein